MCGRSFSLVIAKSESLEIVNVVFSMFVLYMKPLPGFRGYGLLCRSRCAHGREQLTSDQLIICGLSLTVWILFLLYELIVLGAKALYLGENVTECEIPKGCYSTLFEAQTLLNMTFVSKCKSAVICWSISDLIS